MWRLDDAGRSIARALASCIAVAAVVVPASSAAAVPSKGATSGHRSPAGGGSAEVFLSAGSNPAGATAPGPAPAHGNPARRGRLVYLALGDSVAFGFVPPEAVPPPDYADASTFVGYPEDLAEMLGQPVFNPSCPGETTISMIDPGGLSNGCENAPGSPIGYRTLYPLHVLYRGSQISYAMAFLESHPATDLVTIDIGANDVFRCEATTADDCASASEIDRVIASVETNLTTIYTDIRRVAHYHGRLVALTYYSTSYSNAQTVAGTQLLDSAIARVTGRFGGKIADGFKAFQTPSDRFGGDPCAAGLLFKLPDGSCNIHPSVLGRRVLGAAIARVARIRAR
jgi:lysophospholipase L1-like esterase